MNIKHIFKNSMTAFGVVAVMSFAGAAHAANVNNKPTAVSGAPSMYDNAVNGASSMYDKASKAASNASTQDYLSLTGNGASIIHNKASDAIYNASTQDYLSLIGMNGLDKATVVKVSKTKVNCAPPPESKALNWKDCLGGLQNMSIAGMFGFDINSLLNSLATAACSYAKQKTGALVNTATAGATTAINKTTVGAGLNKANKALNTVGNTGNISTPVGNVYSGITQGGANGQNGKIITHAINPFTGRSITTPQ